MKEDHLIFAKFGLWARKLIVSSSCLAIALVVNISKKKKNIKKESKRQDNRNC